MGKTLSEGLDLWEWSKARRLGHKS
jgi:hypothetical protein